MKKGERTKRTEAGQAMVEFVIILIIVMGCCAGMCAMMRLLTFQFWAQQEARYLAFERVWSADDYYTETGENPASLLDQGPQIGRPQVVTDRDHSRNTNDDGNVTGLLSWLWDEKDSGEGVLPTEMQKPAPSILLAKFKPQEMFSWVSDAVAKQDTLSAEEIEIIEIPNPKGGGAIRYPAPVGSKEKIGRAFQNIFHQEGFGEKFCTAIAGKLERAGLGHLAGPAKKSECGRSIDEDFGMYLGENLDFKDFFQDFGERLEWGDAPDTAMSDTIRHAVGNHFYSFFDNLVRLGRTVSIAQLIADAVDANSTVLSSSTTQMVSDFRYVGSSLAVGAVIAAAPALTGLQLTTRDPNLILQREKQFIIDILHVDAGDSFGGAAFFLSPTYLPVPPTFGATAPAFQEAAMKNVLFEESGLVPRLIDESNKQTAVTYKASGGLFPAAVRRFRNIQNAELSANNYIVTQPWHITRRISATGDYRQKGTEFDEISDDTEEGILRKRVSGLWLFPSNVGAFLQPIAALPGLSFLGPVFSAFEPIGSILGFVKSFVLVDNPIFKILDFMHDIPGIGSIFPTVPKWPAVRPDAYIGSEELTSNDPDKEDELMGNKREFQDYVDEQRDFNPEPNPTFN